MCVKTGIKKGVSVLSLRRSFTTYLRESGVDLRYMQEILGHKSSKATEIYTHVSRASSTKIKNPLDSIFKRDKHDYIQKHVYTQYCIYTPKLEGYPQYRYKTLDETGRIEKSRR